MRKLNGLSWHVASRRVAGKWKLHTVSAASNKRGEIVLRIKKTNLVMAFSHAKESKEPARSTFPVSSCLLPRTDWTDPAATWPRTRAQA